MATSHHMSYLMHQQWYCNYLNIIFVNIFHHPGTFCMLSPLSVIQFLHRNPSFFPPCNILKRVPGYHHCPFLCIFHMQNFSCPPNQLLLPTSNIYLSIYLNTFFHEFSHLGLVRRLALISKAALTSSLTLPQQFGGRLPYLCRVPQVFLIKTLDIVCCCAKSNSVST